MTARKRIRLHRILPPGILAAALVLGGARVEAADFTLVRDGKPAATIVIAENALESNRFAAEELQTYVRRMSGAELPLATDNTALAGPKILIGRSRLTDALKMKIPAGFTRALKEEGFIIQTAGDDLVLAGNDGGPYRAPSAKDPSSFTNVYKGSLFAVYEVLERLGCRWYYPGEFGEVVPKVRTLSMPATDETVRPSFPVRGFWYGLSAAHSQATNFNPQTFDAMMSLWMVRNRFLPYGSVLSSAGDGSIMGPFKKMVPVVVDGKKERVNQMFLDHPEYFAVRKDGSRNEHYLCLAHTGVVAVATEAALQFFRENPQANCFGYAPPDGAPTCECEACRFHNYNLMQKEPYDSRIQDISEGFYRFLNAVAVGVEQEFPGKWITSTAYSGRTRPPMATRLNGNLSLHLAFLGYPQHHRLDFRGWMTQEKATLLRRWAKVNPFMVERQYYPAFQFHCNVPLPMHRAHAYNVRQLKEMGMAGAEWEGRAAFKTDLLNYYVLGRMLWNQDTDVDKLLAEHNRLFYGPAAGPVGIFIDSLEELLTQAPVEYHEEERLPEIYPHEKIVALTDALGDIEALAAQSDAATRTRVRFARLQADHLRAYSGMRHAEADLDFATAAGKAQQMIAMEREFDAINPALVDTVMAKFDAGKLYGELGANATARGKLRQYLAKQEMVAGPRGDLAAALPVDWSFRTDPHDEGLLAGWFDAGGGGNDAWKMIATTRCWETQGYQDEKNLRGYDGFAWYRTRFTVPAKFKGRRIKLFIGGINNQGWCWVNGAIADQIPYHAGYMRWLYHCEIDVTDQVRFDGENELTVRLFNDANFGGIFRRCFVYAERATP